MIITVIVRRLFAKNSKALIKHQYLVPKADAESLTRLGGDLLIKRSTDWNLRATSITSVIERSLELSYVAKRNTALRSKSPIMRSTQLSIAALTLSGFIFTACRFDEPFVQGRPVPLADTFRGWWLWEEGNFPTAFKRVERVGILDLEGEADLIIVQQADGWQAFLEAKAFDFRDSILVSAKLLSEKSIHRPYEVMCVRLVKDKPDMLEVTFLSNGSYGVHEKINPNDITRSNAEDFTKLFGSPVRFRKEADLLQDNVK